MLQHPSKFHSHPLSHFLALHNSAVAAAANNQHHHHFQSQSHLSHQSQSPLHSNHTASQLASQIHLNGPHPIVGNLDSSTTTSLDVGKSFTIAAILGLQKSAIEQSQKDCGNSAMNLSRSTYHHHHHNSHHQSQKSNFSQNNGNSAGSGGIGAGGSNGSNSNNNNNNINNSVSGNCGNNGVTNSNGGLNLNIFDCDSVNASVINRYLPSNNINNSNNPNHIRFNHFGHHHQSVVTAAAAVVNSAGGPSALQSLQQLHQQHAQQATLGFQTQNKVKNDLLSSKKSSLKSKRVRTIFTPEQLERLEAEFERQQYMVGPERLYLAHTLQLTEAQVKVWFQNRRIKWRKHHLEITQQRLALIRQRQLPSSDANITSPEVANQLRQSESDLSVCNDSMDTESVNESDDI